MPETPLEFKVAAKAKKVGTFLRRAYASESWRHVHEKGWNYLEKEYQDGSEPYKDALRVLCEPDDVE